MSKISLKGKRFKIVKGHGRCKKTNRLDELNKKRVKGMSKRRKSGGVEDREKLLNIIFNT